MATEEAQAPQAALLPCRGCATCLFSARACHAPAPAPLLHTPIPAPPEHLVLQQQLLEGAVHLVQHRHHVGRVARGQRLLSQPAGDVLAR